MIRAAHQQGEEAMIALVENLLKAQAVEHLFYELDAKLLRYILMNLLENTVKYSPAGSSVTF